MIFSSCKNKNLPLFPSETTSSNPSTNKPCSTQTLSTPNPFKKKKKTPPFSSPNSKIPSSNQLSDSLHSLQHYVQFHKILTPRKSRALSFSLCSVCYTLCRQGNVAFWKSILFKAYFSASFLNFSHMKIISPFQWCSRSLLRFRMNLNIQTHCAKQRKS